MSSARTEVQLESQLQLSQIAYWYSVGQTQSELWSIPKGSFQMLASVTHLLSATGENGLPNAFYFGYSTLEVEATSLSVFSIAFRLLLCFVVYLSPL